MRQAPEAEKVIHFPDIIIRKSDFHDGTPFATVRVAEYKMLDLVKIRDLLDQRRAGHTLPQAFYRDPDVFAFDLAAIHGRSWFMIGFEVEIPTTGSYISTVIGQTPVVIVRGRDGSIRGFFNSCRHRGAQICPSGHGKNSRLVCPYHQWTYALDGKLMHAGRMHDDFDPNDHSLIPIHIETVAGTIYACIALEPPDFGAFKKEMGALLAPHRFEDAKVAHENTIVDRANWKLVMENARECYHCDAKHPELSFTFPTSSAKYARNEAGFENAFETRMVEAGFPVGPVEGDWWQGRRFPLNEGCVSMTETGRPCVAKSMVEAMEGDIGTMRWALEPHSFTHALGDYVFMFSAMPTGPNETVVTSKWLVHKDAEVDVDYRLEDLIGTWNATNAQDRDLAENNQLGVNGSGYRPGPYSQEAEHLVLRFVDWYCAKARHYVEANS